MTDFLKDYGRTAGPLGFPQLDRQARALEAVLKTLPSTKEYQYRHRVMSRAPSELNPGERSDVSWISTESLDREGEVVIARGMNDSQFQSNPLVTLGHSYWMPPVGRSLWRKRVKDGDLVGIKAKTKYPEKPQDWSEPWPPDRVFALVQAGLLQGKSIGFLPTKVHFADRKEAAQRDCPEGTLIFDEWLLLEYAVVFLPANQDALVESVSKGLEVTADLLRAMGLAGLDLGARGDPAKGDLLPGGKTIPFTALSEVERAVQSALEGIDFASLATQRVADVCDRLRGRV
jgi:hypothetical protein